MRNKKKSGLLKVLQDRQVRAKKRKQKGTDRFRGSVQIKIRG